MHICRSIKLVKKLLIFVVLVGSFPYYQNATAADGKMYPATFCQMQTGQQGIDRNDFRVSQFGKIANHSGRTMRVVCPVIRDVQGHNFDFGSVLAITKGSERVRCNLRAMNPGADRTLGQTGFISAVKIGPQPPSPPDNRWEIVQFLSFPVPSKQSGLGGGAALTGAMYVIVCDIPSGGELMSYYFVEND
jgi:hypothetical protein